MSIDYETKLQLYQTLFQTDPKFSVLLKQLAQTIAAYRQQRLPTFILPNLDVTPDDLTRLLTNSKFSVGKNWSQKEEQIEDLARFLGDFRNYLQEELGIWALLNQPMLTCWTQEFPHYRYLELMSGNGMLSWALRQKQQTVYATDNFSWAQTSKTGRKLWTSVQKQDALTAVLEKGQQVDVILLAWSPDREEIDWQLLQAIRQLQPRPQFWLIGEYRGVTNSQLFWDQAQLHYDRRIAQINRYYPSLDLIKDHLFVIR
ncbi:hypothetical protein HU830_01220 [Lactobacillus sp. DCY120]|uniref:SAM-dependent methyltransferase n=1 Tax=Bombilactobacillus apium TaxID=2675299 RepID=A0A850QYM8_9LACO|nr:hypothetical protein [Bombilactobacillus apium]NVY95829.1 hypothetical protein [Bombilactobacillus apium]